MPLSLGLDTAEAAKTTICHKPGTAYQTTLEVEVPDVDDHLGHGDVLGACEPLQPTVAYTCSSSSQTYVRFYVRSGVTGATKGTEDAPFGSVGAALAYAEKKGIPAVELQIASGVYPPEAVALTRHTRMVGPGRDEGPSAQLALSVSSSGPFELGIQGVVFTASGLGPALTVSDSGASTALCNIGFDGVVGHALAQSAGSLTADDLVADATVRDPEADDTPLTGDHLTGTALILDGGVDASLSDVHLDGSEGSGLHVTGDGTVAQLDWLASSASTITHGTGCLGALVVGGGAELYSRNTTLEGNRVRGITVEGENSESEFQYPTVEDTRFLGGSDEAMSAACGFNAVLSVYVRDGATLTMAAAEDDPFLIGDSDSVGLAVAGPAVPVLHLADGVLRNHPLGAYIQADECDYASPWYAVYLEVRKMYFVDNDVNLDSPCVSLPPPPGEFICQDGVDNDGDGDIDCADSDCAGAPYCSSARIIPAPSESPSSGPSINVVVGTCGARQHGELYPL